jgi:hypothetical protein
MQDGAGISYSLVGARPLGGLHLLCTIIFLLLGIQAIVLLTSIFAWLLPVGVDLLMGSFLYLGTRINLDSHFG